MNYFVCEYCGGTAYVKDKNSNTYSCTRCKTKYNVCSECGGTGYVILETGLFDCDKCDGSGLIPRKSQNAKKL